VVISYLELRVEVVVTNVDTHVVGDEVVYVLVDKAVHTVDVLNEGVGLFSVERVAEVEEGPLVNVVKVGKLMLS
jgi:hypothetical protein